MYNKITVRQASSADLPELLAIEKECFSDPWSAESFAATAENECAYLFIAEYDGKAVGFAVAYNAIDFCDIADIAVLPDYRRLGIGKKLISVVTDTLRIAGIKKFTLEVRESNAPASALYTSAGFKPVAVRKGYYSNPRENAIIMYLEE